LIGELFSGCLLKSEDELGIVEPFGVVEARGGVSLKGSMSADAMLRAAESIFIIKYAEITEFL
jgi:hypothetical protein